MRIDRRHPRLARRARRSRLGRQHRRPVAARHTGLDGRRRIGSDGRPLAGRRAGRFDIGYMRRRMADAEAARPGRGGSAAGQPAGHAADETRAGPRRRGDAPALLLDICRVGLAGEGVQCTEQRHQALQHQRVDAVEHHRRHTDRHGDRGQRRGKRRGHPDGEHGDHPHGDRDRADHSGNHVEHRGGDADDLRYRGDAVGKLLVDRATFAEAADGLAGVTPVAGGKIVGGEHPADHRADGRQRKAARQRRPGKTRDQPPGTDLEGLAAGADGRPHERAMAQPAQRAGACLVDDEPGAPRAARGTDPRRGRAPALVLGEFLVDQRDVAGGQRLEPAICGDFTRRSCAGGVALEPASASAPAAISGAFACSPGPCTALGSGATGLAFGRCGLAGFGLAALAPFRACTARAALTPAGARCAIAAAATRPTVAQFQRRRSDGPGLALGGAVMRWPSAPGHRRLDRSGFNRCRLLDLLFLLAGRAIERLAAARQGCVEPLRRRRAARIGDDLGVAGRGIAAGLEKLRHARTRRGLFRRACALLRVRRRRRPSLAAIHLRDGRGAAHGLRLRRRGRARPASACRACDTRPPAQHSVRPRPARAPARRPAPRPQAPRCGYGRRRGRSWRPGG